MKADVCGRCGVNLTTDNWQPSYRKKRYLICAECELERQRVYRANNPAVMHNSNRRKKYGIEFFEYEALLEKQGNVCAICGGKEEHSTKHNLSVDHCHETGVIRGLLCSECNIGLGKFRDSVSLLDKAKEYLIESRSG